MKDPAFLFYYQDFLVGTTFFSNEEVGAYIRILCHLADKGSISLSAVKKICVTDEVFNTVSQKLQIDENGNYFNQRLREEIEKRKKFSESRRKNIQKRYSAQNKSISSNPIQSLSSVSTNAVDDIHMNNTSITSEIHMENEIVVEDENINEVFKETAIAIDGSHTAYPPEPIDFSNSISNDAQKLFPIWGRPASLGEIQICEKLINEYSFENVKQAFYLSAEQGIKKLSYVRGILKKKKSEKEKNKKNQQLLNSFKPLPPEDKNNWKGFSKQTLSSLRNLSTNPDGNS